MALRDPWRRSMATAVALIVAGFVAILIAWVGVSATLVIPTQVSFAVSGGIGGFALVGCGVALLEIQRRRYAAAEERRDFAAFAAGLSDLAELVAERGSVPRATSRRAPKARRQLRARASRS